MVNINGYIRFISESGGSRDTDGNPVASEIMYSEYIKCNLRYITKEYKTLVDQDFVQARFIVMTNISDFNSLSISINNVKQVELQGAMQENLGLFRINQYKKLPLTKHYRFVV